MKKFLMIFVALLMITTLVSCGKEDDPDTDPVKRTVIKYCNWNFGTEEDNNIIRRRVAQFNKESTTTRIEMVVVPTEGSYDEFIATLAAGGELPDVFMVNSVPTAVINKWALDITQYTNADAEWQNIPSSLRDSITYNGQVYGVPAGQYYMGLFANLELIGRYINEDPAKLFETGEFSTEQWIDTVKKMRDINHKDGTGVIGMNAVGDMVNWLPATLDETGKIKHFVFNGSKFDFTSEILMSALEKIADLGDPTEQYVFDSVPITIGEGEEQQENRSVIFGAGGATDVFLNGQMGFIQEGSWANTFENTDFDCTFTSYPDGKVVAATDYMVISRSSKNPQVAYEVAKYMTFGESGLKATFDIIDKNQADNPNLSLTGIPLNTKEELSTKWFSYIKMKGLKETFEKVANGKIEVVVEGNKYIPGFLKARYNFNTGVSIPTVRDGALLTVGDLIWEVCSGNITVNEYRTLMTPALSEKINGVIKEDYIAMGIEYK